ncbi:unnamed protein product [Clonostachys rosea]|uniref:Carboxylesterase type B domain-containing protein n=1 Tax=Bionectria ochroleuca TaxID=29856 RepID=A0ABY6V5I5_BIOOC|nr:unnamed protein product [Clonostachys rosea]
MAKEKIAMLGLEDVDSSQIFQKLLEIPADDFLSKIPPSSPNMPVIDGDLIPSQFTFKSYDGGHDVLPGQKWIEGIVVGQSTLDSSIMGYSGLLGRKEGIAKSFRVSAEKTLHDHPDALKSLLDHYSLSESAASAISDESVMMNILVFINDVAFLAPAVQLAARASCDSFFITFKEPNPWDGPFKGHSSHILDVAFIFQNYNDHLDDKQRNSAVQLGEDLIKFVSGSAPWKAFNRGEHGVTVYGNGGKVYTEPPKPEITGQSSFIFRLAKDENGPGLDKLMEVFANFMAGK